MKDTISINTNDKKIWNTPNIYILDTKKTQGGTKTEQTEDYASGTRNTNPNS
jgi:hypothetical protein